MNSCDAGTVTISWDGGAGTSSWHDANNWSTNVVPGATDHVCINNAAVVFSSGTTSILSLEVKGASGALTLSGGSLSLTSTVQSSSLRILNFTGGTLGGDGTVTIPSGGKLTWSSGIMVGAGTTEIASGATLALSTNGFKQLHSGRTLANAGTATWGGASDLHVGGGSPSGATITNSGTFEIRNDQNVNQGGNGVFLNTGTVRKTPTLDDTNINVAFDNDGVLEANSGRLFLNGGGVGLGSSGSHTAAAGAAFGFGGGNHTLLAASSVTGAGDVYVFGGQVDVFSSTWTNTGTFFMQGGTANFNSNVTTTLSMSGGTLGGSGTVTLPASPASTWTSGIMIGAGTTQVASGATLALTTNGFKQLHSGRTLGNAGTLTWAGASDLHVGGGSPSGATITNSGTFLVRNDQTITQGGNGVFLNTGTVRKGTAVDDTNINVAFDNDGVLEANSGRLFLNGGGVGVGSSGSHTAAAGAAFGFGGGTHTLLAASSVGGAGDVYAFGGETHVFSGTWTNTGMLFMQGGTINVNSNITAEGEMTGGTLGGSGTVTVPSGGKLTWSSGVMVGAGTTQIASGATLSLGTGGFKQMHSGRTLANAGMATWAGAGDLNVGGGSPSGATITNSGTFEIRNDFRTITQGGNGVFLNTGTVRKTPGVGKTNINVAFDNDGVLQVNSGNLVLNGGGVGANNSGSYAINGTALQFGGGTHVLAAGSSVSGSGRLWVTGGQIDVFSSTWTHTGVVRLSGGTMNVNSNITAKLEMLGGTLGGTGTVTVPAATTATWTSGVMVGSGTTQVASGATLALSTAGFKQLHSGRTLANAGTLTWAGKTGLNVGGGSPSGATITNSGTFVARNDQTIAQGGNGVFLNTGTVRKTPSVGDTNINVVFDNDGVLQANSGRLFLNGGGVGAGSSGSHTAAAGAAFGFGGGTHSLLAASSVTGAGDVYVFGGQVDVFSSTWTNTGTFFMQGGTANLNSNVTTTLSMSGGTLGGTGTVTLPGSPASTWTSGVMVGSGTTQVASGATLAISTAGFKQLHSGRTLANAGTVTWAGKTGLNVGGGSPSGATITNSGTFLVRNDQTIAQGGNGVFLNTGTGILRKSPGLDTTQINTTFTNNGVLDVESGTVNLGGTFTNFSGTTLTSGTYVVQNGSVFSFPGANVVTNSAAITLDGAGSALLDQAGPPNDGLRNLASNTAAANLMITNGRNLATPGTFGNAGAVTIGPNTSFTSTGNYNQTGGTTHVAETTSSLTATGGILNLTGGVLSGNGTVGPGVSNASEARPGTSPGILSVSGPYAQTAAGRLRVDVAGNTVGTGFDRLSATAAATLAGTLTIDTAQTFMPAPGETFQILSGSSRTGTFGTVQGASLGAGVSYNVQYNPANVTLSVTGPAANTCARSGSTLVVAIASGGNVTIGRSGSNFNVTGTGIADATCGASTMTNVDTVKVAGAAGNETLTVNLANGQFAPGATVEAAGSSEIEFVVNLGGGTTDTLVVQGSGGDDTVRLGTLGIDPNNDGDPDITTNKVEKHTVNGAIGADLLTGAGNSGTGSVFATALTLSGGAGIDNLTGGSGNDTINANDAAGGDIVNCGLGADTVTANAGDTVAGDCETVTIV